MADFRGRGLHGQVVNALGRRIMTGAVRPGQFIDPEAVMAEFGVSRTVVREALKVLAAKGLVDARPKLGTYVTERGSWQLLDVDVMTWRTEGTPDSRLVIELDQVRAIIEPAAAALAAQRRSPAQLAAIEHALQEMVRSHERGDHDEHVDHDVAFHLAILAAGGNELLEKFEVVLEPALRARHTLAMRHAASRGYIDGHMSVFEAIAAEKPEAARDRMQLLIDQSSGDIAQILAGHEKASPGAGSSYSPGV